ncbi:putative adhesin [Aliivibrio fischeri]
MEKKTKDSFPYNVLNHPSITSTPLVFASPGLTSIQYAIAQLSLDHNESVMDFAFEYLQHANLSQAKEFRTRGYNRFLPQFDFSLRDELEQHVQRLESDIELHGININSDQLRDVQIIAGKLRSQIECISQVQDQESTQERVEKWIEAHVPKKIVGEARPLERALGVTRHAKPEEHYGSRKVAQSLVRRLEGALKAMNLVAQSLSELVINSNSEQYDIHIERELIREMAHDYHKIAPVSPSPEMCSQLHEKVNTFITDEKLDEKAEVDSEGMYEQAKEAYSAQLSEEELRTEINAITAQSPKDERRRLWLQIRDERVVSALEQRLTFQNKACDDIQNEITKLDKKLNGASLPLIKNIHLQPSSSLPFKGEACTYLAVTEGLLSNALAIIKTDKLKTANRLSEELKNLKQYLPKEKNQTYSMMSIAAIEKGVQEIKSGVVKATKAVFVSEPVKALKQQLTKLEKSVKDTNDKVLLVANKAKGKGHVSYRVLDEKCKDKKTSQLISDSIVRSVLWQLQQSMADLQQAAQPLLSSSKMLAQIKAPLPENFDHEFKSTSSPSPLMDILLHKRHLESPEMKMWTKQSTLNEILVKHVEQVKAAVKALETNERSDSPIDILAAFKLSFYKKATDLSNELMSALDLSLAEQEEINNRCHDLLMEGDKPLLERMAKTQFEVIELLNQAVDLTTSSPCHFSQVKDFTERAILKSLLMKVRLAERSAQETGRDLDDTSRGARIAKHWAMILAEKIEASQALPSPGEVLALINRYGLNEETHSSGDPKGALMATRLSAELARAQAGTLLPVMTPERYAEYEKDLVEFMVAWGQRRFTRGVTEHVFELALSIPTTFMFNIFSPLYRLPLASLRIPYKVYKTKSLIMPGSDKPYKAIDMMIKKRMKQLGFHMVTSPMPTVMKTALGGVLAGAGYVYNKHVSGKEQTLDGIYEQVVNGKQSQQLRMDGLGALALRSVTALSNSGFEVLSDHVQRQVLTLSTPVESQLSDLLDGLLDDEAFEGTMSDIEWAVDAIEQNGEKGTPVEYIDAQEVSSNSLDEPWSLEMEDETSTSRRVRRSLDDDDTPHAAELYRPQRLLPYIQQRNVPMPRQELEDYLYNGSVREQTEKQEINDAYQLKGLTSAQRRQVTDVDDSICEPFNSTESDQHRMDAFKWLLTEKWAEKGAPVTEKFIDTVKVFTHGVVPDRIGIPRSDREVYTLSSSKTQRIVLFGQEWAYQEYDKPSTGERIYKIGLPDGSKFVQVVPQNGTFKLVVADDIWEYNRQKALKYLNLDGYPESLKTLIKSEMRHIERGANPRDFREYQLRLYRMLSLLSQVNAGAPRWDLSAYEGAGVPDDVREMITRTVKLKQLAANWVDLFPSISQQLYSIATSPSPNLAPIKAALKINNIDLDVQIEHTEFDADRTQEYQRLMMNPRIRNEVHQYYRAFIDKAKSDVFAQLVPYLVNSEEKLNALNLSREQRTQISEEIAEFNASVARSPEEVFSMYNRATREWEGQLERVALGIHGNPVEQVVAAYKRRKLALFIDHHYSGIGGDHFELGYQYYSDLETHFYLDDLPTRSLVFDEQLADLKALWPSDVLRDREGVNRVLTKLAAYNNKLQSSAAPRRVKVGMNVVCSSLRFHAKVMEHAPHLLSESEYEQVMENLRVSLERWRHDCDVNEDDVKAIEPSLQEVVFRLSGGLSLNRTFELPRSGMSHRTLATYFSLQTGFSQPSIAKWLERSIVLKTPDGQVQFQPLHVYLRAGHPLQVLHYKGLLNNPDEEPISDDVIRRLDASLADYRFNLERNSGKLSEYDKALSGFNQRLNVALPRYVSVSLPRNGQSQELVLMPTALFLSGAIDNANAYWPLSLDTAQMRSLDETYDEALEQMKMHFFDAHKHETKVLKEEYGEELFRQRLPIDGTQSLVCFHALLSGRLPYHLVERVRKPDSLSALQWEAIVSGQAYQDILKAADELEALETRTRDLLAKGEQALETLQTPAQFIEGLFARYHINANDTFTVTARKVVPDYIKHNKEELAEFKRRYPDKSFEVNYLDYVRGVDETHLETDRWAGHTLDFEVPQPLRRLVLENGNIESVYQTYLNTQINDEASQGVNLIYRLIDKSQFSDVEALKDYLNNAMDSFYLNEHEAVGLQWLTRAQQIYAVADIALPINPLANLALDLIFEYGFSKWKQALATEEFGDAFNQEANINLVYSLVIGGMRLSPKAQKVIHRLRASSSIDTSSISSAGSQALQSLKGQASALYRSVFPVDEVFPERVAKIRHNNLDDADGGALVDDVASDTSAFTTTERPFQLMGKAMLGRKTRQGKFSVSWNNGETWQAGNKVSLFAWTLQNACGRVRLAQSLDGVSHRSVDVQDVPLHQRAGGGSTDNAGPSIRAVEGEGRPMNGGNPPLRRPLLGEEVWKGSSQVLPGSDQDFVLYLDAGGQPEAFFDTLTEVAPRLSAKRFSYFGKTLEGKVESGGFWVKSNEVGAQWVQGSWLQQATWRFKYRQGKVSDVQNWMRTSIERVEKTQCTAVSVTPPPSTMLSRQARSRLKR